MSPLTGITGSAHIIKEEKMKDYILISGICLISIVWQWPFHDPPVGDIRWEVWNLEIFGNSSVARKC